MNCKICAGSAVGFGAASLLAKHRVAYFRCTSCGFVQTEEPYWLDEAYSDAITKSDLGLISRNMFAAQSTQRVINAFYNGGGRFLDYGGGYGMMVRMMRDVGFDFYRSDKYCANLFAQGFDATLECGGGAQYELATAFEVFEHLAEPLSEIETILRYSRNVLFSTTLLPEPAPQPGAWWYYGLEHGQHVALYTEKSLAAIAARFRLNFYTDGQSLHLLTEKRLSTKQFKRVLTSKFVLPILHKVKYRRQSLLHADFARVIGKEIG